MKTLAVVIASVFNLLAFGNAYAHGDHPSEHGGVVGRGDDAIVVEFVMEKGTIKVNSRMETNLPGIYSAGDVATYDGKLKLIATGTGEVTVAVNYAKTFIDPTARAFPGHSSELIK